MSVTKTLSQTPRRVLSQARGTLGTGTADPSRPAGLDRPTAASSAETQVLLRLQGVRRRFGDRYVLDGIDLEVRAGEFVSVLGRSGTGKSTLLRALDGFDREVTGYIEVPERRAVVYQDARLLPWARVLDNVVLGLEGKSARARARQALAEVSLTTHERAWPSTLSGGEAQRAALARALIREPDLLLLDEPFGALDALTRITMHGLLRTLCDRHHPAVLLVTHDVNEAIALSDRIVVLDGGRVIYDEEIALDHPRQLHHEGFASLREELHERLGVASDATLATGSPQTSTQPDPNEHPNEKGSHHDEQ
jgi:sulfonate transport system ATP-binding protein